eukprot:1142707-Pelagomonas_calceolata.AAC.1
MIDCQTVGWHQALRWCVKKSLHLMCPAIFLVYMTLEAALGCMSTQKSVWNPFLFMKAFPTYNGILLDKAIDIAQRLRPAFDSPTGLPYLFVNLRKVRAGS